MFPTINSCEFVILSFLKLQTFLNLHIKYQTLIIILSSSSSILNSSMGHTRPQLSYSKPLRLSCCTQRKAKIRTIVMYCTSINIISRFRQAVRNIPLMASSPIFKKICLIRDHAKQATSTVTQLLAKGLPEVPKVLRLATKYMILNKIQCKQTSNNGYKISSDKVLNWVWLITNESSDKGYVFFWWNSSQFILF